MTGLRPETSTAPPEASSAATGSVRLLHQYFEQTCDSRPTAIAVVTETARLSYAELDRRANRLASLLLQRGVRPGDTVGILLERSVDTYVALLGTLKAGAAYVPMDCSFHADRLAFMAADSSLRDLVTTSVWRQSVANVVCPVLELDDAEPEIAAQPGERPHVEISPSSPSYIIYTSGSTGRPKGVSVSHASIVNFLQVATPVYGVTREDRVYQGVSISFDFHLEEMWPAWVAGAALIAGPNDGRRFGEGLANFLTEHGITVFCSVPTMLTTIDAAVPSLRRLLVSGEPMPADLVRRWWRPGLRILNCYGPTEATVSASCREMRPGEPVTLGTPFPSYRFYVLDDDLREVAPGEPGEICIGGPGVAIGYLNRPELTADRFVPNPVARDRAEAPRIYRTGDLGRRTSADEYEYLGRMDTQVKIRGYRVELGEIEQVIREDHAVENAVVVPLASDGVAHNLVGYVTLTGGSACQDDELRTRLHGSLRRRLAPYMVPSFIEVLDRLPLLAADKVNRAALPPPVSRPLTADSGPHVPARTELEARLAAVWANVLGTPDISVEADFFCDLGGHSLAAARVVSALRGQPGLRALAMSDLYATPTVRGLAEYIEHCLAAPEEDATVPPSLRHSALRVFGCGLAQLVLLYVWLLVLASPLLALVGAALTEVSPQRTNLSVPDLHAAQLAALWVTWFLATVFLFPALGSRLVLAGVRPGRYPLWGLTYLRFWLHSRIIALSPQRLLAGSPMLAPYLRLLGARVGRRCQLSPAAVGLPRFVEIGHGVSIGENAHVQPYFVRDGWLWLAPIRIGDGVFVGANCTVLAGAEIGPNAVVGHHSLVHADQRVPADEHWAGSPLQRAETHLHLLDVLARSADSDRWKVSVLLCYVAGLLVLVALPALVSIPSWGLIIYVTLRWDLAHGAVSVLLAGPLYVVVTCLTLVGLKRVVLPRVDVGIHPERGPLAARMWFAARLVDASIVLVRTIYCTLYVIPFLRGLGLRLGRWCEIAVPSHLNTDMAVFGDQCFLAAGVVVAPVVHHQGQIAVHPAELARRSFVGNVALVPGGARMGENSLLGVLSVPPDRPLDPETTWLGSPAFFLPRRQASEKFPDKLTYTPTPGLVAARLAVEVFRVALPATILLLAGLIELYVVVQLLLTTPPLVVLAALPAVGFVAGLACTLLVVALKWLIMGRYRPRTEPYWGMWVRGTELITGLYEAVVIPRLVGPLIGTPWICVVLRLFGARIGRRVWLNSASMTEFDLVEIGDDAMVGDQSDPQTHLFEDRVMKMSHSRIGAAATVGAHAVVLYDAEASDGAHLDALSLVMKGEVLPTESRWRGIPARPLRSRSA